MFQIGALMARQIRPSPTGRGHQRAFYDTRLRHAKVVFHVQRLWMIGAEFCFCQRDDVA